jgi:hypothetical protein
MIAQYLWLFKKAVTITLTMKALKLKEKGKEKGLKPEISGSKWLILQYIVSCPSSNTRSVRYCLLCTLR